MIYEALVPSTHAIKNKFEIIKNEHILPSYPYLSCFIAPSSFYNLCYMCFMIV